MAGRVYLSEDAAASVQKVVTDHRRKHHNDAPGRANENRYNAPEWQFMRNDSTEPDADGYYQATLVLWNSETEAFEDQGTVYLRNAN